MVNLFALIFVIEMAGLILIIMMEDAGTKDLIRKFGEGGNNVFVKRCLQVSMQTLCSAPLLINSVVDLINFFFVIHCETQNKKLKENDQDQTEPSLNRAKTLSEALEKQSLKNTARTERQDLISKPITDGVDSPKKQKSKKPKNFTQAFTDDKKSRSKVRKSTGRFDRKSDKRSSLIFSNKDENRIKVIQPSVLTDLGDINHAIFDKTDTLTLSTIEIVQLASSTKLYNLDIKTLFQMYREVKRDPTKYQRMEDLEEVMKQKEDDNYSEKS
jgi:hypothetical protein